MWCLPVFLLTGGEESESIASTVPFGWCVMCACLLSAGQCPEEPKCLSKHVASTWVISSWKKLAAPQPQWPCLCPHLQWSVGSPPWGQHPKADPCGWLDEGQLFSTPGLHPRSSSMTRNPGRTLRPRSVRVTVAQKQGEFRGTASSITGVPDGGPSVLNSLGPEGWARQLSHQATAGGRLRDTGEATARRLARRVCGGLRDCSRRAYPETWEVGWIENLIMVALKSKELREKVYLQLANRKVKHFKNYTLVP